MITTRVAAPQSYEYAVVWETADGTSGGTVGPISGEFAVAMDQYEVQLAMGNKARIERRIVGDWEVMQLPKP